MMIYANMGTLCRSLIAFFLFYLSSASHAVTIVQMAMQYDNALTNVYVEIYDDSRPVNASNFLGYVNRGDFDDSFFHRKATYQDGTPFVIQGGGFTYKPEFDIHARLEPAFGTTLVEFADPVTGELGLRPIGEEYVLDADNDNIPDVDSNGDTIYRTNDGLQEVPVDTSSLPVISEAGISNTRGTLAMALTSAGADSATQQWFVNMSDNLQLNTQNGGFTVFGRVIGNGMTFFDDVNNRTVINAFASNVHPELGSLPVINYEPFSLVVEENLVKVKRAREVLRVDPSFHDFGFVEPGSTAKIDITVSVSAQWPSNLDIENVGAVELLEEPFSMSTDCEASQLSPGDTCTITVEFAPAAVGNFDDTLAISFANSDIPYITMRFIGTSGTVNELDLGDVLKSTQITDFFRISNSGNSALTISSIVIEGEDAADFSYSSGCGILQPTESCTVYVRFFSDTTGLKSAVLKVSSDDPDNPVYTVDLSASSSEDADNVPDIIELVSPNDGDGNNDGASDHVQSNVVSLAGLSGKYLTLATEGSLLFNGTRIEEVMQPGELPQNRQYPHGALSFTLGELLSTGVFEVGLILPAGSAPASYYQFGPTADNPVPHWYEFMYDGVTGAQIFRNVSISTGSGDGTITRDFIRIWYGDGSRGDNDLVANRSVTAVGVIASSPDSGNGSQMNLVMLIVISLVVAAGRALHKKSGQRPL